MYDIYNFSNCILIIMEKMLYILTFSYINDFILFILLHDINIKNLKISNL